MTRPDIDWIGRDYLCLLSQHLPVSLALLSYQSHDDILMSPWVNCAGVFLQASFGVPLRGTVSPVFELTFLSTVGSACGLCGFAGSICSWEVLRE
jgi:hypothetical protein